MKIRPKPLRWIFVHAKPVAIHIIVLIVIGIISSYLGVRLALISGDVVDAATKSAEGNFINKGIGLAIIVVLQLLAGILSSTLNVYTVGKLNIAFKKKIFSTLIFKDWKSVSDYHSGELVNRIKNDVSVVTSALVEILPNGLAFITRIVLSFSALFIMEPVFAVIFMVAGLITMVLVRIYSARMKSLHKRCQESEGVTHSFMQECLQNLLVVKTFRNESNMIKQAVSLQSIYNKLTLKRNNISIVVNSLFYMTITAGYYMALAWGAYRISLGRMTYGELTIILQLVGQVQMPIRSLSSIIPQYYSMIASTERMMEMEELPDEVQLNTTSFENNNLYEQLEEIQLNGVSFSYSQDEILTNLSLNIKKGQFVAFYGRSGIGKSTILKLLLGIMPPSKGEICLLLDDGKKIPVDKYTRTLFAYVPQGNMILSGSIRENIIFSNEEINEEEIIRCAKTAEIWDYIESLPEKLDTKLGKKAWACLKGKFSALLSREHCITRRRFSFWMKPHRVWMKRRRGLF